MVKKKILIHFGWKKNKQKHLMLSYGDVVIAIYFLCNCILSKSVASNRIEMSNSVFWKKKIRKISSIRHLQNLARAGHGGSVGCASDWRPGGCGFDPLRGRQHSFVEIDHEIFSTVILSLPLIQEGQLSVSGKRICTILVNHLED